MGVIEEQQLAYPGQHVVLGGKGYRVVLGGKGYWVRVKGGDSSIYFLLSPSPRLRGLPCHRSRQGSIVIAW